MQLKTEVQEIVSQLLNINYSQPILFKFASKNELKELAFQDFKLIFPEAEIIEIAEKAFFEKEKNPTNHEGLVENLIRRNFAPFDNMAGAFFLKSKQLAIKKGLHTPAINAATIFLAAQFLHDLKTNFSSQYIEENYRKTVFHAFEKKIFSTGNENALQIVVQGVGEYCAKKVAQQTQLFECPEPNERVLASKGLNFIEKLEFQLQQNPLPLMLENYPSIQEIENVDAYLERIESSQQNLISIKSML